MALSSDAMLCKQPACSEFGSYSLLFGIALIALLLRLHSFDYIPESLWNEDAILIDQAHQLGVSSLWTPYPGGYHFLYHRLVALLASQFPLVYTPYIFFLGWLLSFLSIVLVLSERARLIGIDRVTAMLVTMAVVFQPSHGEAWFNLNQAHFTTGAALSFYICMPVQRAPRASEIVFLLVTSLSGITSVLIAPILLLQLRILRDFQTRRAVYIVVLSSACAEATLSLFSERLATTATNTDPLAWASAAKAFFFFGAESQVLYVLGAAFWTITVFGLVRWAKGEERNSNAPLWLSPLSALFAALIMFVASGRASGDYLSLMSPLDMDSRYFIIPYALIFFASLLVNRINRQALLVVSTTIALICASTFRTVDRPDRQSSTGLLQHSDLEWSAFARLHEVRPDIAIPINANWPTYPPIWMVTAHSASISAEGSAPIVDGIEVRPNNARLPRQQQHAAWTLSTRGQTPVLEILLGQSCASSEYLGVEVAAWRSRMGLAELRWGGSRLHEGNSRNSLSRFYPAGKVLMQFAVRRSRADSTLSLHLATGVANSALVQEINRLVPSSSPLVVAKPTEPGGDVRIESVRLFCLRN